MAGPLTWSPTLGKRVRVGEWSEQAIGTTHKVADAIRAGR
jgi:hypothetical protein